MYRISSGIERAICAATPRERYLNNKAAILELKKESPNLDTLARFNGWGATPAVFDPKELKWAQAAQKELRELIGDTAFSKASDSILNAHYTSFEIIRAIWGIVEKLGFNGGRILEPSCGSGYFFGLMPEKIARNSQLFGVEIDPIPAAIAQALYPEAKIYNQGFESFEFPDAYFDLVVGDVPFGHYGVSDPRYSFLSINIHNYFLARASDLVRPGGLIAVITSLSTLAAPTNRKFRTYLSGKLRLVEAISLPMGWQGDVSHTEAGADLLIFQRLDEGIDSNGEQWIEASQVNINPRKWKEGDEDKWYQVYLNEWYISEFAGRANDLEYAKLAKTSRDGDWWKSRIYSHPHRLLGIPTINKIYGEDFALKSDGRNLSEAIAKIPFHPIYTRIARTEEPLILPPELQETKNLAFCLYQGAIYQRVNTRLVPVPEEIRAGRTTVANTGDRIQDYWKLSKVLQKVIAAQSSPKELESYQQALKLVYDYFVSRWGKVNSKGNVALLGQDPGYFLVRTLEKEDGELADIFTARVCRQYGAPAIADNPIDALTASLNVKGRFDIDYICEILGNPPSEKVIDYLAGKELIFYDPAQKQWELKEQYLSGNVYQKLQDAMSAGLEANITALKAVQPAPMLPEASDEIKIACLESLGIDWLGLEPEAQKEILGRTVKLRLGTAWIPAEVYRSFATEVLQIKVAIKYLPPPAAVWVVDGRSSDTTEYGTRILDSAEIFKSALNLKDPKVIIEKGEFIDWEASNVATEEARGKLKFMKAAFLDWVYKDTARAVQLCLYYNCNINVMRDRVYDGSWLALPGSNPTIELRPWQKNAVSRIIQNPGAFLAHDVGTGKTYTAITAIMECRRLGLAKKPMFVALNGTEKQIEADWRKLYPLANILVPKKFDAEGRKLFTAQIKTADFDGVILTHSQFFSLAMSDDYQLAFLENEKQIVQEYMRDNRDNRGAVKNLKTILKRVEKRIKDIKNSPRKDNHIDFEGLTDMLVIDEIHRMKNLSVTTKMYGIRGIPTTYSQRATDSYMKILHVLGEMLENTASQVQGKVVGLTGTILSNTMAEIFTWQRMFQSKVLNQMSFNHFDSWASQFGEAITAAEVNPSGQYKVNTRFKSFVNLPVLKRIMGQFVDIVTAEMAGDVLMRPDAQFIDVSMAPSQAQLGFLRDAARRAEAIKNRMVDPNEDNMLKVTSDLTKAALSMRLMGHPNESPESKLHECAFNVWQIWRTTTPVLGTQLIFCDFSTPKPDRYNVYEYIKLVLIALGIPESDIAFVHDWNGNKRAELFTKVNSGEIRIVLGSTEKLGTGCNVHRNGLWAMHHVDAPWRPADIEQREGRGIRQGNGEGIKGNLPTLKKTYVFRYITEQLDALRWQTLQWKQEMIKKFIGGFEIDSIEDCDRAVYSYAQVKSLATGNPLLIEDANLRNELASLLIAQRAHQETQLNLSFQVSRWSNKIGALLRVTDWIEADIAAKQEPQEGDITSEELMAKIDSISDESRSKKIVIQGYSFGTYRGFKITGHGSYFGVYLELRRNDYLYELPLRFGDKSYNAIYNADQILPSLDCIIDEALPKYLAYQYQELEQAKVEQKRCQSLIGKAFPDTERILEIQSRLAEIDEVMKEEEAALSATAEESDDKEEEGEFWNLDDNSIATVLVDESTIHALKNRSADIEWLQEIEQHVQDRQAALAG